MADTAPGALIIAILGAESTGKTTLAAALATRLALDTAQRVAWVPEYLREWCDHVGRTPLAHEQAAILRTQHERIDAAAATHDIVICDTTGVMTAIYSAMLFGDRSLEAPAVARHCRVALTLLTAVDLPWVGDGIQRDGPQVRAPVDAALRELLRRARLPYAVIGGEGEERLARALAAVKPMLMRGDGQFTRLSGDSATRHQPAAPPQGRRPDGDARRHTRERWACSCCDVPEYEQALRPRR